MQTVGAVGIRRSAPRVQVVVSKAPWIDESPERAAQVRVADAAFHLGLAPWVILGVTGLMALLGYALPSQVVAPGLAVALALAVGAIVMGAGQPHPRARVGFLVGLFTPFAIVLVSVFACLSGFPGGLD